MKSFLKCFIVFVSFCFLNEAQAQKQPKAGDYINIMSDPLAKNPVSVPGKITEVKGNSITFKETFTGHPVKVTFKKLSDQTASWGIGTHEGTFVEGSFLKIRKGTELLITFFRPDMSKKYEGKESVKLFETFRDEWDAIGGFAFGQFPDGIMAPLYIDNADPAGYRVMIISADKLFIYNKAKFQLVKSYTPRYKPGTKIIFYAVEKF